MLPSSNYNPFSYSPIENLSGECSTNYDQNPNYEASLLSYFPFPFLDDHDLLLDHLVQQQKFMVGVSDIVAESDFYFGASNKATDVNTHEISNTACTEQMPSKANPKTRSDSAKNPNPEKRTGKKDRHSKINTAHGPRDRRMRLSLPISREFFGLQDLLGVDTASKTIEWLFTESKAAIKELVRRKQPEMEKNHLIATVEGETLVGFNGGEQKNKKSRKASSNPLARESRDKARARARERTREKMMIRSHEKSEQYCLEPNPKSLDSSGTPLEGGEEEQLSSQSSEHQLATVEIIEKLWGTPSSLASPFSMYDFDQNNVSVSDGVQSNNNFMGFLGNGDFNNYDYCGVTNKVPLAGNDHDQNPSSMFMTTSNIHFQSQF